MSSQAKSRIVPFRRTLRKGDIGDDVLAVKRALRHAAYYVLPQGQEITRQFGDRMQTAIRRFQQKNGLTVDGIYGILTHRKLMQHFDSYGAHLMGQAPTQTSPATNPRALVVNEATWGYNNRGSIHYRQFRPMQTLDSGHRLPQTLDCSEFATVCYRRAGVPDPNGRGYDGLGYCMEPSARLLTRDLRWKAAGDIEVGDELWACDENHSEGARRGRARKWRGAVVVASFLSRKPSVRVCLDTGEAFVCSTDHPWLAAHLAKGNLFWFRADRLLGKRVTRVVMPWVEDRSWEAGWLAGMFDGEGWCRNRPNRGGRTVYVGATQAVGETADRLVAVAERLGDFSLHRVDRRGMGRPRIEIMSNGRGVPGMMDFLGRVRPERLIGNFSVEGGVMLSIARPEVVAIEDVGYREVQSIQTTTGTYIAEGFAVHNTGTLSSRGVLVSTNQARPGDLVFYGNGWPYSHVSVYVGFGRCISHGSESGPSLVPLDYRGDRRCIRSYLL